MKLKLIATFFTSIALLTPIGAQAFPCTTSICDISIAGGAYKIYQQTTFPSPPTLGLLEPVASNLGNIKDVLMNNPIKPGNVELGALSPTPTLTTMTVTFNGGAVATLSNLLLSDWKNDSDALARSYITAAGNSVGIALTTSQLDAATAYFLTQDVTTGIKIWQLPSDPNIATIDRVNGQIKVGLDGLLHPTNFLNTLFFGAGVSVPAGKDAQASEVVKVTYNGSSQYLYSFSATDTGYQTGDGTQSYNGRYTDQTVPEPTTLLLLGFGFIGLAYMHRHNKREQAIDA